MEYIIIALVAAAVIYTFVEHKRSDKKSAPVSKPAKAVKKSTPSVAQLKKLTKVQLLELADKNNIKVKRSGSKAEVVKTIASHK
jgi:Mn-dependent DtxR family transcriptional regulator